MSKREFVMKVSGGNLPRGKSYQIPCTMDFTGCTRDELIDWALSERRIAAQRWLRLQSEEFLAELQKKGLRLHARDAGRQLADPNKRVQELRKLGLPDELARLVVSNPEKVQELLAKLTK